MTDKMSLAFQYCNQHIGIIYGVMKKLYITAQHHDYDDLRSEGVLKFVNVYCNWREALTTTAQQQKFNKMVFGAVYRHLLNYLHHENYYQQYHVLAATDNELLNTCDFPHAEVETNTLLNELLQHCTSRERQFINYRYHHHLNMQATAQAMHISVRTAQRLKQRLRVKAQQLGLF